MEAEFGPALASEILMYIASGYSVDNAIQTVLFK